MHTCPAPIFSNNRRSKIEGKSQHHDHHRTDKRIFITYPVKQTSCPRTIEQIPQEEGKGDKCCQEILSSSHFRKKGYLQRPLTLSVDGSEKAHNEIYECQEKERSRTLERYRLFHNHLGFYSTEYCFSSGASRTPTFSEAPDSYFSEYLPQTTGFLLPKPSSHPWP